MLAERKKGVTLINSIIAFSLFSIMFMSVLFFHCVNINITKRQELISEGTYRLEGVKNIVIANYDYEKVKSIFLNKAIFISDDMVDNFLDGKADISELDLNKKSGEDYIIINSSEAGSGVIKLEANYCYKGGSLKCIFYKGNYPRIAEDPY